MKIIVAGSRDIEDYELVRAGIERSGFPITELVSGRARGVDSLGEEYARQHGIPVRFFPADWTAYGKAAGAIRNQEMADYADGLVAVWDGVSPGTAHMVRCAKNRGLQLFLYMVGYLGKSGIPPYVEPSASLNALFEDD